jgi:putative membrane protein
MKLLPLLTAAALLTATSAFAQDAAQTPKGAQPTADMAGSAAAVPSPQQFATTAGVSNLFEIASSKVALTKAQNADVKTFAQRMIDDHTKAGDEMAIAAKSDNVAPPADLDQANQAKLDQMNGLSGDAFDKAYSAAQLQAHADAVALFQGYAANGNPGALKDFAAKTLPTLQMHYAMAQKLPQ